MSLLAAIGPMQEALDYHLSRHNLLSANLAHVDTPGYRPRELYRASSFEAILETRLSATSELHQGVSSTPPGWKVGIDRNAPVKADGNGVNLDREAVKIAANNLRYDTLATIVQGQLASMQWAAQDGR
jgi:flagellar basal-body rod protein FlgB